MSPATSSEASVCAVVPDVGQPDPAVGLALEDPGLDQPPPLRGVARIARVGERLGDHGADGKLEDVVVAVGRVRARRQLDEPEFVRVVAEQRRVEVVGDDSRRGFLRRGVAREQGVLREPLRMADRAPSWLPLPASRNRRRPEATRRPGRQTPPARARQPPRSPRSLTSGPRSRPAPAAGARRRTP